MTRDPRKVLEYRSPVHRKPVSAATLVVGSLVVIFLLALVVWVGALAWMLNMGGHPVSGVLVILLALGLLATAWVVVQEVWHESRRDE